MFILQAASARPRVCPLFLYCFAPASRLQNARPRMLMHCFWNHFNGRTFIPDATECLDRLRLRQMQACTRLNRAEYKDKWSRAQKQTESSRHRASLGPVRFGRIGPFPALFRVEQIDPVWNWV
jgi:hypothetical protein